MENVSKISIISNAYSVTTILGIPFIYHALSQSLNFTGWSLLVNLYIYG